MFSMLGASFSWEWEWSGTKEHSLRNQSCLTSNDHLGNSIELGPGKFNEINRCSVIPGHLLTRSLWTKEALGTDLSNCLAFFRHSLSITDSYFPSKLPRCPQGYLRAEVWPQAGVTLITMLDNKTQRCPTGLAQTEALKSTGGHQEQE